MSRPLIIQSVYICDRKQGCSQDNPICGIECKHSNSSEHAVNKESVDIYEKFINRFDVEVDATGHVIFFEREVPYGQRVWI